MRFYQMNSKIKCFGDQMLLLFCVVTEIKSNLLLVSNFDNIVFDIPNTPLLFMFSYLFKSPIVNNQDIKIITSVRDINLIDLPIQRQLILLHLISDQIKISPR